MIVLLQDLLSSSVDVLVVGVLNLPFLIRMGKKRYWNTTFYFKVSHQTLISKGYKSNELLNLILRGTWFWWTWFALLVDYILLFFINFLACVSYSINCIRLFGHSLTLVTRFENYWRDIKLIRYYLLRRQLNIIWYKYKIGMVDNISTILLLILLKNY